MYKILVVDDDKEIVKAIEIYLGKRILHQLVIEDIKKLDGVRYVEEL